ncbi:hypothetical protein Tco_1400966 [Tanacetum coccineum]
MDSQYFKDKALLMEAKEKGDVLDAEAEAFLADVECTAPYDQPQALTTTNMFQANHEDAYDSDVDEGPNAAVAFMANLSSTSATNNPVNEVHSNDNQIFDNVDYQLSQEMHQEEHLDSDAETEIDDNTIPYHQYLLDTEAQNVPTEVSADTSDKVSMIAILTTSKRQQDVQAMSLMYLTSSRPNIMFSVCACSRFQFQPKVSHLNAVKRIFRYLKGRPKLGLWYPKDSPFILEAFSESDYAGASLDWKSTKGGCQFLGSRLISWQCKKQIVVANSTTEAEYIAASHCCGQVLWIQNQMLDYGYNFMQIKIHVDNESVICVVKNHVYHSKTKHIEIRHPFIRDSYEKTLIEMVKIHTDYNVADLLTKAFDVTRYRGLYTNEPLEALFKEKLYGTMCINAVDYTTWILRIECKSWQRRKVTPLFDSMLVQNQAPEGEGSTTPPEPPTVNTPIGSQRNMGRGVLLLSSQDLKVYDNATDVTQLSY